jgi:predicted MFS family arabinose efflux permease
MFTVLTYIAPLLAHEAGIDANGAALALLVYGAGPPREKCSAAGSPIGGSSRHFC